MAADLVEGNTKPSLLFATLKKKKKGREKERGLAFIPFDKLRDQKFSKAISHFYTLRQVQGPDIFKNFHFSLFIFHFKWPIVVKLNQIPTTA